MSLFSDVIGNVVLKYKADTSDAQKNIKALAGEQKKAAQQAVDGLKDQQAAADMFEKRSVKAFAAVGGAIALGVAGFKKYEESVRLTAATSSVDMGRLQTASRGLMTQMELMRFAADGMNGRWKMTSAEMETVLGAARALELRGIAPLSEASEKLGAAIRKGETEPLKELGIAYDEALAKTDKRAAAMKALQALSAESARTATTETEAVRQHGAVFREQMDSVMKSLGQVAVSLGPIIREVAMLAEIAAGIVGAVGNILTGGGGGKGSVFDLANPDTKLTFGPSAGSTVSTIGTIIGAIPEAYQSQKWHAEQARIKAREEESRRNFVNMIEGHMGKGTSHTPLPSPRRGGGGSRGYSIKQYDGEMRNFQLGPGAAEVQIIRLLEALRDIAPGLAGEAEAMFDGATGALGPRFQADSAAGSFGKKQFAREGKPTILQQMFGEADEINGYTRAWGTLQDAMVGGFEAIVTGSEDAGTAIKRIIGQSIMAEGSRMLVMALREGAMAVAELARGNFPGAATHGKAALMFGAGAVAAGVAANALGVGGTKPSGGSAGAGAGASASGIGLGGGAVTGTDQRTIVLGMGWDEESPRARAARLARAMRRTSIYEQARKSVSYS